MTVKTKVCPYCAEEINKDAIKCKHCGEFLNAEDIFPEKTPQENNLKTNSDNVRKGVTNAKFNEKNSSILYAELLFIAIACGIYWHSWGIFGSVLIGLIIALLIKPLAVLLCLLLSIGWAVVGYGIGSFFQGDSASIVLAIIGFLIGIGAHYSALEWTRDISEIES